MRFLGIELLDAQTGWVSMKLSYRTELTHPGSMHGGAIYALADSAAAHAVMTMTLPKQLAATVEQRINFFRPVRGQDIFAEAKVVHAGKTLAYCEVTVAFADGTMVAKSAATLMRVDFVKTQSSETT